MDDITSEKKLYRFQSAIIELQDPIPSAKHVYITCRKVLHDVVDLINKTIDDTYNNEYDINEINEMNELSLPLQFDSKRKRRKKKDVKVIKRDNNFPFMDNVFMVMYDEDSKFYPAEVLGVGPSKPSLSSCIVRFVSYGTICEVKRSELVKVPIHYQENIDTDIMNCYDFNQPNDVHEKYWDQRYRLLSKYDKGVLLDTESWYSITPEIIAKHIAQRCLQQFNKNDKKINIVLDCFCGCGGNSIAMAEICNNLLAIDIDPDKIKKIAHNAEIYGVSGNIIPICNDVYKVLNALKNKKADNDIGIQSPDNIDIIVLSPPWGGMDYDVGSFDIRNFPSGNGYELITLALSICSNIVCVFPRNTVNKHLKDFARRMNTTCFVEDTQLYGKKKMKIYYFGYTLFK
jgi:predicted RNA methylase